MCRGSQSCHRGFSNVDLDSSPFRNRGAQVGGPRFEISLIDDFVCKIQFEEESFPRLRQTEESSSPSLTSAHLAPFCLVQVLRLSQPLSTISTSEAGLGELKGSGASRHHRQYLGSILMVLGDKLNLKRNP